MPSGWGGQRPGAGRKRGNAHSRAHVLTRALKEKDWVKLVRHLQEIALSSSPDALRAASLLMRYEFGMSPDSVEHALSEERRRDAFRHILFRDEKSKEGSEKSKDPFAAPSRRDNQVGVSPDSPDLKRQ